MGRTGLEPVTSSMSTRRASQLRQWPSLGMRVRTHVTPAARQYPTAPGADTLDYTLTANPWHKANDDTPAPVVQLGRNLDRRLYSGDAG